MSVLIVGSTALDSIKTPKREHPLLLGGSASHASVAASFFAPVNLVGIVGDDFPRRYLELYRKHYAFEFDSIDFYYCFGLFRLAVIAQQIYYRFYHKQTTDERFKMMIFAVQILEKAALRTMEAGFN